MDDVIDGVKTGLQNFGKMVQDGYLDDRDMVGDALYNGINAYVSKSQVSTYMERYPRTTREEACIEQFRDDGLICDYAYNNIKAQQMKEKERKQRQEEEEYNLKLRPYIGDNNESGMMNQINEVLQNQYGFNSYNVGGKYDSNNQGSYNNPYRQYDDYNY